MNVSEAYVADSPSHLLCALIGSPQGFCKEVVAWSSLRHPNVLPLLGATMTDTQFVMVSEWMENGDINEFVGAHPDADRLGLVCVLFEVVLSLFLLMAT